MICRSVDVFGNSGNNCHIRKDLIVFGMVPGEDIEALDKNMGLYFHLFANGDDAKNFITSIMDFEAAFNRVALCVALCPATRVLAYTIEETHPHFLIYGEWTDCIRFKKFYESLTLHYIVATRGNNDGVVFELELLPIRDEDHLLNTAAYILVQPTKDGKQVLPHYYKWGTASLYFKPKGYPLLWEFNEEWERIPSNRFGSLKERDKRRFVHSRYMVPDDWKICGNLILPTNFVEVERFESLFRSFNRFRTYMAAGKKQLESVTGSMAIARGVNLNDLEARAISRDVSQQLFGKKDSRSLNVSQRIELASRLRNDHHISVRQIATLVRLPESEIRKYFYR